MILRFPVKESTSVSARIYLEVWGLCIFLSLGALAAVSGTTFPVASIAEFNAATAVAGPGDEIVWQAGTYADVEIITDANVAGAPGNPLTITAETPGSVVFSGISHVLLRGDHLVLDGIILRNGQPPPGIVDAVEFKGNFCTMRNCEVTHYQLASSSTRIDYVRLGGRENLIEYCTFGDRPQGEVGNMIVVESATLLADFHVQYATTTLTDVTICDNSAFSTPIPPPGSSPYDLTAPSEIARLQADLQEELDKQTGLASVTYIGGVLDIAIAGAAIIFKDADGHAFDMTNPPANHVIRGNRFVNYPSADLSSQGAASDGQRMNGYETIRIGNACNASKITNVQIEDNYFYRCDGEDEMISMKTSGMTFRRNSLIECRGTISFRQGEGNTVESNYLIGNHVTLTGGVRIFDRDQTVINNHFQSLNCLKLNSTTSYRESLAPVALGCGVGDPDPDPEGHDQIQNALISHNTFALNRLDLFYGAQYSSPTRVSLPDNTVISYNLLWGFSHDLMDVKPDARTPLPTLNVVWHNNLVFGASVDSGVPSSGYTFANPNLFQNDWLWELDPIAGSPAIDPPNTSAPAVINDIDGQARDSLPDIGADEVFTANAPPITSSLLQINEVGTFWSQAAATSSGLVEFSATESNIVIPTGASGIVYVPLSLTRRGGSSGEISATCVVESALFSAGPAAVDGPPTYSVTWSDGDQSQKTITIPVNTANLMINGGSNYPASEIHPLFIRIDEVTGGALPGIRASASISRESHPYGIWAGTLMGNHLDPAAQPTANFDNDDSLNALEYALANGNPINTNDEEILPGITTPEASQRITFQRNLDATGILYEVQKALSPAGPWVPRAWRNVYKSTVNSVWNSTNDTLVTEDLAGIVTVETPTNPDETRGFWRLRIALINPEP